MKQDPYSRLRMPGPSPGERERPRALTARKWEGHADAGPEPTDGGSSPGGPEGRDGVIAHGRPFRAPARRTLARIRGARLQRRRVEPADPVQDLEQEAP